MRNSKKKLFSIKLQDLHKELVRKSVPYSKYPDDLVIWGSFFKFRKMYSHACQKKSEHFKGI